MIEYGESFDDNSKLPFIFHPQINPAPEQVHFCHNLILNIFDKRKSPYKQEFPELRTKRQNLHPYLKVICHITSYYGIFTMEIVQPQLNQTIHQIQRDVIDIEFSKVSSTDYIKNIKHQISQRANSKFTNEDFSIIYIYLSILELKIYIN